MVFRHKSSFKVDDTSTIALLRGPSCVARQAPPTRRVVRVLLAVVWFAQRVRRIGEASNPGPFQNGGASSSGLGTGIQARLPGSTTEAGASTIASSGPSQTLPPEECSQEALIPVKYSDADIQHRFGVQLLYQQDVLPFLEDELYGENWDANAVQQAIKEIAHTGRGQIDLVQFIRGPSDYASFVPPPLELERQIQSDAFCPAVSVADNPNDLELVFLRRQEKRKDFPGNAELVMNMHKAFTDSADLPLIEEDAIAQMKTTDFGTGHNTFSSVGPATMNELRRKRAGRRRRKQQSEADPPPTVLVEASNPSKRRNRTRRKNSRQGTGCVKILLLNSSGRPQLEAALQSCEKDVGVILNQEHHANGMAFVDLQYEADRAGWKLQGAQAKHTDKNSFSAGTAIACRKRIGMGDVNAAYDHSPAHSGGRISAAWLQIGPPSGVVVISLYLYTQEGMTPRNRGLLSTAVALARASGSPWIVGGDMNMPPGDLASGASSVLEQANAYVFATERPTNYPTSGAARTLDYVITSDIVYHWIESLHVHDGIEAKPHRAVCVTLKASVKNFLVKTLKTPSKFSDVRPIGCARALVVPEWWDPCQGRSSPSHEGEEHIFSSAATER